MSYQVGDILLNKYRIEQLVGRGAFAEVYHVTHLQLNAPRAIKLLRKDAPGLGSSEYQTYAERFQLEAQLGAMFEHQNIVRVYDLEQDGETLLLVMAYCPGGSLADLLRETRSKGQSLPVERVLKIGKEIASGLAALHAKDIVHRDLKPNNILFDAQGQAKVADLGLAQTPGGLSQRSVLGSLTPRHPGTPGYMSPEQEKETAYLKSPADVYALGINLFEALTGRNYSNLKPGTRLSSLREDMPAWLDSLLNRMLAENPKERPWDGAEVLSELQAGKGSVATRQAASQPEVNSPALQDDARVLERSADPESELKASQGGNTQVSPGVESQGGVQAILSMLAKVPWYLKLGCLSAPVLAMLFLFILFQMLKPDPAPVAAVVSPAKSMPNENLQSLTIPTTTIPRSEQPTSTPTMVTSPTDTALPSHTPAPTQPTLVASIDDRIVFNSNRSGKDEIWMMNADGSDLRQLTYLNTDTRTPSWSPDKKSIAFQSYKDGDFDIYTMSVSPPGNPKKITDNSCPDFSPSWSPDGKWIAYYSSCDGNREIYKIRTDGSQLTQLTRTSGDLSNLFPTWSPDGKQIAYASYNGRAYEITIMDADGRNSYTITKGCHPNFSPNGNKIVFSSLCFDPGDLFIFDLMTGSISELYVNPWSKATSDFDGISPAWSPDGEWIVFYNKSTQNGYADIWMIDASGTKFSQLTDDSYHDSSPTW